MWSFFLTSSGAAWENAIACRVSPVPTLAFNRVYILLHIYRHLFFEGIGLRQILDYYYVLLQGMTETEKSDFIFVLKSLRLLKFAGALMYVMQRVFGLEDKYAFVTPNTKLGRFLLKEVMIAGNFGNMTTGIILVNMSIPLIGQLRLLSVV